MRFFWKATPECRDHPNGVKCKIVRPVSFSQTFDVYDFCTEAVKAELRQNRLADEKVANERFYKKRALDFEEESEAAPGVSVGAVAASQSVEEDEDEAALKAALAMSIGAEPPTTVFSTQSRPACFNQGVPNDFSGTYELFGVVTHKGRDADSGHYIGWVRQAEGSDLWWKYDDETVTEVNTAEILELKGGRDIAYLNFYRCLSKQN